MDWQIGAAPDSIGCVCRSPISFGHGQQKQLFLHTQQELQEKILDRKQAGAAAVALVVVQKKAAEAEAAVLKQEKAQLEGQVTREGERDAQCARLLLLAVHCDDLAAAVTARVMLHRRCSI